MTREAIDGCDRAGIRDLSQGSFKHSFRYGFFPDHLVRSHELIFAFDLGISEDSNLEGVANGLKCILADEDLLALGQFFESSGQVNGRSEERRVGKECRL